jgi:prepilin-type processing-associated H-X9-DG protein
LFLDARSFDVFFRPDYPPPVSSACINRHNGYVNGLFLDWSVRRVGLKELWTLKWHMQFDTANAWTKAGGVQPEDWPAWMRGFKDY